MRTRTSKVFSERREGDKLRRLKKIRESCRANLRRCPNDPVYLHVMGLIECKLGRPLAGMKWLKRSLDVQPNSPDVLCHYALTLMERSKYPEALRALHRAVTINSKHVESFYHLGNALKILGDDDRAMRAYMRVLALNPKHAETLNNLGTLLNDQKRYAAAILFFHRAIVAQPDCLMAYNNIGVSLAALNMLDEAQQFYNHALKQKPDYPEAWNNLGIIFRLRGQFEESANCFRKALTLRPIYAEARNNLGNALKDCGEMDEAILSYRHAVQLRDTGDNHHNLALALMAAGRLQEGWREYEWRWKSNQLASGFRSFAQPLWQGELAKGKTLLLHAEQGFGDTIQFCRYATLAAERGLRIILEVQPPLANLMKSLAGVETVIARGEPLPHFDLHCPLLSLPLVFDTSLETVPARNPYLAAADEAISIWRGRLAEYDDCLKVGLVWAGKPQRHTPDLAATDRRRSMPPEYLTPLADLEDTRFFSLQKAGPAAPAALRFVDHMDQCRDFADTAALIANLDLVISVDTAVAHLAAAIGKPVWLLNRFDTCWRWLRDREDSPWYPSLRIFRQPRPGAWESVVARVREALIDKLSIIVSSGDPSWPPPFLVGTPARIPPHSTSPCMN